MSEVPTADGVEVIDRATVFQGYFRIDRYTVRHRRFGGGWTAPITREVFERGHAVAVLLYDPERDMVGLTEQFRIAAFAAGRHPWLIETVAGVIDKGESEQATAIREVREEAGVEVDQLVPCFKLILSPGGASETVQVFCARIDASRLGGVHGLAEEGEDIRVFAVAADEALGWIDQGRISNGSTVAAIQWLALHRQELRKKWAGTNP